MGARNVGTFNYDIGQFPDQPHAAANCQYPSAKNKAALRLP
jgi:hypothetical protein